MAGKGKRQVGTLWVDRGKLLARPERGGGLSGRARRAIARRLAGGGAYPAVIVRPHPRRKGMYEIIDGHSRVDLLGELGQAEVRCEVWPADDAEADVLAVTLNQLRGRPDLRARARRVGRVVRRLGADQAAEVLGLSPASLRQQLAALRRPPTPVGGQPPGLDLRPLVFHVPTSQLGAIERSLRRHGKGLSRGEALVASLRKADGRKASRGMDHARNTQRNGKRKPFFQGASIGFSTHM